MWPGKKIKRSDGRRTTRQRLAMAADKPVLPGLSLWAIVIGLMFVLATSLVIISGVRAVQWREGQKTAEEIRARVQFRVPDTQLTEQARIEAQESTPNYYYLNDAFLGQVERDVTGFTTMLRSTPDYDKLPEARRHELTNVWRVTKEQYAALVAIANVEAEPKRFSEKMLQLRRALVNGSVIQKMPEAYERVTSVVLEDRAARTQLPTKTFIFPQQTVDVGRLVDSAVMPFSTLVRPIVRQYLMRCFQTDNQAVWLFDENETKKQRQLRYNDNSNKRYQTFEKGQVLVDRNVVIREVELQLLAIEHTQYLASLDQRTKMLAAAGTFSVVLLVTLMIGVYSVKFEPVSVRNWSRTLALALTMLAMIVLARVLKMGGVNDYASVFQVVLFALVMTVAYNQRFALMATMALVCFILTALQGGVGLLLTMLASGVTVVMILDEIRSRAKLIEVALASALMSFAVVLAYQLSNFQELRYVVVSGVWASAAAFVAVFIFQGILPLIERLFAIATSMTLLEWCDASKPLLRRLTLEIPGTFHHAQLISSMAENAAEAIGANGLLARVGAMYHDVGKLAKPDYFVENQPARSLTRHKGLSPAMSLLVIVGHVKDGLEIAREYGLPKVLHQFIGEHHGTTLVEFFYHLDSQQRAEAGLEPAPDVTFRYPGPKPRTKESAILMLADAAESATRALSEPTVGRIESQVHQIVRKRVEDGQLDDCQLTFRQLHQVEASLTKSLWAMYHGRIKYPTPVADDRSAVADRVEASEASHESKDENAATPPDESQATNESPRND
jgi:putative nucleotidyltransferase with HDIG domain